MSNFAKVFEIDLHSLGISLWSQLSDCQHGLIPGISTATNLVCTTIFISEKLDLGRQNDGITRIFRVMYYCQASDF